MRVVQNDDMLIIEISNEREALILLSAGSYGRRGFAQVRDEMYGVTWLREIKLEKEQVEALLEGLDDYITDIGTIIHNIENGVEESKKYHDVKYLIELNQKAKWMYEAIEAMYKKM